MTQHGRLRCVERDIEIGHGAEARRHDLLVAAPGEARTPEQRGQRVAAKLGQRRRIGTQHGKTHEPQRLPGETRQMQLIDEPLLPAHLHRRRRERHIERERLTRVALRPCDGRHQQQHAEDARAREAGPAPSKSKRRLVHGSRLHSWLRLHSWSR